MMNFPHIVLGFDIRTPGVVAGGVQYYDAIAAPFKPITKPWITFDKYVNPSVFTHKDQNSLTQPKKISQRVAIPKNRNYGFDLFMLWDDVMDMMVSYPNNKNAADAAYAYAWINLVELGIPAPNDETFEVLTNRKVHPDSIPEASILIGYDVVSPYFISALSGYDHSMSDPEFVEIIKKHINSFGLISEKSSIIELAEIVKIVQKEIDEDPFFMIAIFLLWDKSDYSLADPNSSKL